MGETWHTTKTARRSTLPECLHIRGHLPSKGAALLLPYANTEAMQMHLIEISRQIARKAHAVLLMAKLQIGQDGIQRVS